MWRRPGVLTALVFGAFLFLAISFLLARGLGGAGVERARTLDVLRAQARGDVPGMLAQLTGCRAEPACADVLRARAPGLRRPGEVEILSFQPSVRLTMGERTGTARVAWRTPATLPVVQCVRVRRAGPFRGGDVELLAISAPIPREGSCA